MLVCGCCSKIVKEVVHRENSMSSDKPFASPLVFSSPLGPAAAENSPAQQRSSLDGSFRSPFLISAAPDVFNSPSVTRSRSVEASRRRPSPFPHHHEPKKMKLSSDDMPDSGSSPSESDTSPPSVTSNTSPSNALLSPLSPIRSPTAEESTNSIPSKMPSASPELDALLATVSDSSQASSNVDAPDSQVNSSAPQVSEAPSVMTTTLLPLQLPSDQVTSVSDTSSPACSAPDGSPPSEPDIPHHDTPVLPESPASLSSPLASSPPPELQSYSAPASEPAEPKILCSLLSDQPEPEVCSSTTLPASESDAAASDVSGAEAMLVDEDSEIQSGEKVVESTKCSAESREACCDIEMSASASAKGTAFRKRFRFLM